MFRMGGAALVPARPQSMVAGGRVLGEDGRGRAVTGPILYIFFAGKNFSRTSGFDFLVNRLTMMSAAREAIRAG